jgi:hypothetical protein
MVYMKKTTACKHFSLYTSAAALTAALCMPVSALALPSVMIYSEPHGVDYQAPNHTRELAIASLYHVRMNNEESAQKSAFAAEIPGDLQISVTLDEESPAPLAYAYDALSLIDSEAKISAHYTEMNAAHQFAAPVGFAETREEKPDVMTFEQREAYGVVVNFDHALTDEVVVHNYVGVMVASDGEKTPVASSKISFTPEKDLSFSVESNHLPDLSVRSGERTEILGSVTFRF